MTGASTNIISIALQKGGTGKTTTALCLAGGLILKGKKVLLVDLDPQGNASKSLIDIEYLNQPDTLTTLEVLTDPKVAIQDCILETYSGIYLLPANNRLSTAETQLASMKFREVLLQKKVQTFLKDQAALSSDSLAESDEEDNQPVKFDYVLFDCPPSLGLLTLNALLASTGILIPIETGEYAMQGLSSFLETYQEAQQYNPKLTITGVVLTMVDNTLTSKKVAGDVKEILSEYVFKSSISRRTLLSQVPTRGPVQQYAPNSESAIEYNNLTQELIDATTK